ncbi:phosphodiesterase [Terrabacter sp. 2RAF25]|uniref:phosphodiesterase n=1 Tax=Terrabacter sp. 2RAF25 TaxID=3232998 RepID=UPI003F9E0D35
MTARLSPIGPARPHRDRDRLTDGTDGTGGTGSMGLSDAPPRAVGAVLAGALGAVAAITRRKPLHAVGTTWEAELRVDSPLPDLGVAVFEDRGAHACTVRVSRALGTPSGWWDIGGLALRLPGAGPQWGPADLLFATTGTGRATRHLLRPVRHATERPLTTLLPTRAAGRSLVLLARPTSGDDEPRQYELSVGADGAAWRPVGLIDLLHERMDTPTRFDPIVNELSGTTPPSWVVAVREPAYRWARRLGRRRSRGAAWPSSWSSDDGG